MPNFQLSSEANLRTRAFTCRQVDRPRAFLFHGAALIAITCGASCKKESPTTESPNARLSAPAIVKLAEADGFDGTVDHVVAKCPACALAMDGKPDHTLKLDDYTLRFCSAHCLKEFADKPESAVLALRIPQR